MSSDNKSLEYLKQSLTEAEKGMADGDCVELVMYIPEGRKPIKLMITDRLRKQCKKGKVWKSKEMLTALKNAAYGFDPEHACSPGGYDGIFLLSRDYKPKNEMMRKLFDRFLDKPISGADKLALIFGHKPEKLLPVRLVSHHMRLLGLLHQGPDYDHLVLVDYDDTKH